MADWASEELERFRFAAPHDRVAPRQGLKSWLVRLPLLRPAFSAALALAAAIAGPMLLWSSLSWLTTPRRDLLPDSPVLEAPAWNPILKAAPAFSFEAPQFSRDQAAHEARRHNPGGGREDVFTFGAPGGEQGFARVVAYRIGSEAPPPHTFYLELARRAAEAGFAVIRTVFTEPLPSRFGLLEAAELTLSGEGGEQRCMGWRMVADEQDLRVSGWLCAGPGKVVDRRSLACFAERLDLPPAQTDKALRAFFSVADRNRTSGCPAARPVLAGRRPA